MEVSLDNIRHNYRVIRNHVKPAKVMPVIKSNAYGMGMIPVAWALKTEGAGFFGVATPDEAVELKEAGIDDPVIVLGSSPYGAAETYVRLGIRAAITDVLMVKALSRVAVRQNRRAYVHFKVDSGMGRIGFLPDAILSIVEEAVKLPGIHLEGVYTHFSTADTDNLDYAHEQFRVFSSVVESLRKAGISVGMLHCCNSGAILNDFSNMFGDAVRPGQILYGIVPSRECGSAVTLKPCFEIKTTVGVIRELPPDYWISYGQTYRTSKMERVAVLPIGYADGLNRVLSNKGEVLIRGKRCPIRGKVCMDQCIVGVSHLTEIEVGDEVVLIGRQGDEIITVEEMADAMCTIREAIPVSITARVPRVYV